MEDLENNIVIEEGYICKSISVEEDANGNYKFEVEASNENLDLQNQITLQSALKKSEEYFITNGVISDDHLHKTRNPDGSVETHKDKIIGEPTSVRFDPTTKKTFVKGILYAGVEAAKPYIDLLKNKSTRVKASIGGIMPKIRKNTDGSETVTSFMWNDLALTCSPVNWTVGSAKFAKSMGIVDFCKSLNAGTGTDASEMEGGRALQNEELEKETVKIQEITNGELTGDSSSDDIEKSNDIVRECRICIGSGELRNKKDVINFLTNKGVEKAEAEKMALEIIKQGGIKMAKSNFSSTIDELLKSFATEETEDKKKKKTDSEEETEQTSLFDDEPKEEEPTEDSEEPEEVEKGCMKKSIDDENDYLDATELMKSMAETIDSQSKKIETLEKSLEEIQSNMIDVTKSFSDYLKTPNARTTVMEKSIGEGESIHQSMKKPTTADLDVLNKALVAAAKKGTVGINDVQFYTSEFQKSMKGQRIDPKVWSDICSIVKENR